MKLDELAALEAAATNAPWTWVEPHSVIHDITEASVRAEVPVAAIEGLFSKRHANGALIVAVRNALPALLEVAQTARTFVTMRETLGKVTPGYYADLRAALDRLEAR